MWVNPTLTSWKIQVGLSKGNPPDKCVHRFLFKVVIFLSRHFFVIFAICKERMKITGLNMSFNHIISRPTALGLLYKHHYIYFCFTNSVSNHLPKRCTSLMVRYRTKWPTALYVTPNKDILKTSIIISHKCLMILFLPNGAYFCLVVDFHRGGSATNKATPSSLLERVKKIFINIYGH